MLGVILWSDPRDRKAVIWCEDQGDLAFLNQSTVDMAQEGFFDAGDVVQFDLDLDQSSTVRKAKNPQLVVEQAGKTLTDALRSVPAAEMEPTGSAEIITFRSPSRTFEPKPPRVASGV